MIERHDRLLAHQAHGYEVAHEVEVIVGRALGWYQEQPGDPGYTEGVETYATGDHTTETMVTALATALAVARAEVARLRAEVEVHALTGDGCVPGAAYQDVCTDLAAARADVAARDAVIEKVRALIEHGEQNRPRDIYGPFGFARVLASDLRDALSAAPTPGLWVQSVDVTERGAWVEITRGGVPVMRGWLHPEPPAAPTPEVDRPPTAKMPPMMCQHDGGPVRPMRHDGQAWVCDHDTPEVDR